MTALMIDKPKGGRGHTAPYDTKQMRVPIGLESQIQELISRYRDWISEAGAQTIGANNPPKLLDKAVNSFIEPVDKLKDEIEDLHKLVDKLTQERNTLDAEINQLHARNGELNLEIAELREQLKPVDKLTEITVDSGDKPVDKLMDDTTASSHKPVDKLSNSKLQPIGQRQLAERLGVSHVTVGRQKKTENFINWSRERDPNQVGWRFDPNSPEGKQFYPVESKSR